MGEVALTPRLDRNLARLTKVAKGVVATVGGGSWAYNQFREAIGSHAEDWQVSRDKDRELKEQLDRDNRREKKAKTKASKKGLDKVRRRLFTHSIYGKKKRSSRFRKKKRWTPSYRRSSFKKRFRSKRPKRSRKRRFY